MSLPEACILIQDGPRRSYAVPLSEFSSEADQKLIESLSNSRSTICLDDMNKKQFNDTNNSSFILYFLLRLYGRHSQLSNNAWSYNEWEQQKFDAWRERFRFPMNSIKDENFFGVLRNKSTQNLWCKFRPVTIIHSIFVRY